MRQTGILAAAGLYALEHNVARLAEDHANARRLAEGLAEIPRVQIDVSRVQSNLVFFSVDGWPDAGARLEAHGVRIGTGSRLRAVTHLDVSAEDITRTIEAARRAWG